MWREIPYLLQRRTKMLKPVVYAKEDDGLGV
jgi:hypothetical protein